MKKLFSIFLFLIFLVWSSALYAGLPNSINAASPADTDLASAGASQIRNVKQFLEDILGLPDNTTISQGLGLWNATTPSYTFSMPTIFFATSTTTTFSGTVNFASTGSLNGTIPGSPVFTGDPMVSRACPAHYARNGFNTCVHDNDPHVSSQIATTCTPITLGATWGVPASVTSVTLSTEIEFSAGTATGMGSSYIYFYYDSGCTVGINPHISTGTYDGPWLAAYLGTTGGGLGPGMVFTNTYQLSGTTNIYAKKIEGLPANAVSVDIITNVQKFTD